MLTAKGTALFIKYLKATCLFLNEIFIVAISLLYSNFFVNKFGGKFINAQIFIFSGLCDIDY